MLQTSSALSHIFPEVRIDACHLVSLLLSIAPAAVVSTWPYPKSALETSSQTAEENTILSGLRLAAGLGGQAGEGGAMGQTLLPASKLVVLKTILAFVRAGLKKQGLVSVGTAVASGSGTIAAKDIPFPQEIFERFDVAHKRTRHPLDGQEDVLKEVNLSDIVPLEQLGEADGWLFGTGQTGLETTGWEIGRRARDDDQDEYDLGEVLSVSRFSRQGTINETRRTNPSEASSPYISTFNPCCFRHSLNRHLQHSAYPPDRLSTCT